MPRDQTISSRLRNRGAYYHSIMYTRECRRLIWKRTSRLSRDPAVQHHIIIRYTYYHHRFTNTSVRRYYDVYMHILSFHLMKSAQTAEHPNREIRRVIWENILTKTCRRNSLILYNNKILISFSIFMITSIETLMLCI